MERNEMITQILSRVMEKLAQAGETRRAYLPSERQQTPAQLLEQYTQRYCVE